MQLTTRVHSIQNFLAQCKALGMILHVLCGGLTGSSNKLRVKGEHCIVGYIIPSIIL